MITKPTLLLDEEKCKRNIEKMFLKAQEHHIDFRPHFKTHQSLEIGRWFKSLGVNKITVSSLEMAVYFSSEWDDITVAFPVNILEIETINTLAKNIRLNLLIESKETILFLAKRLNHKINFFIKINVGNNRTGINPTDTKDIEDILNIAETSNLTTFNGFLGHAGQTYKCKGKNEVLIEHNKSKAILINLKEYFSTQYQDLKLSLGDTPSCSLADDFHGIDEIRPGNFVFYDLMQHQIGACPINEITVAMACPVVAIHQDRNELTIYGGGIHLSKERMEDSIGFLHYGKIVRPLNVGWGELIENMYVKSLSQEHGVIAVPKEEINNFKIGDCVLVLPVHSCMTANLMKHFLTTSNKPIGMFNATIHD